MLKSASWRNPCALCCWTQALFFIYLVDYLSLLIYYTSVSSHVRLLNAEISPFYFVPVFFSFFFSSMICLCFCFSGFSNLAFISLQISTSAAIWLFRLVKTCPFPRFVPRAVFTSVLLLEMNKDLCFSGLLWLINGEVKYLQSTLIKTSGFEKNFWKIRWESLELDRKREHS